MNRISTLFALALLLFPFGFLHANGLPKGTTYQTQTTEQTNDLSWPKAELMDSSLHWKNHADLAHKCLLVHHLDPKDPTVKRLLYEVDLQGERFVAADIPMTSRPAHFDDWDSAADEILRNAGYVQEVSIADSQTLLETQKEATLYHEKFKDHINGYMKRSKDSIRLILITQVLGNAGWGLVGHSKLWIPVNREIFVTGIVRLEQILKEKKQ